jgi:RNA polymerase sigma-70 factor (ECF subfamily)
LIFASGDDESFLARFHAGDRKVLERCYAEHFTTVERVVGKVLPGLDRESVVQDVFCRVVASEALRRNFQGGSLAAWLATVARNQAIDFARRHEVATRFEASQQAEGSADSGRFGEWADAELLIARFRTEVLPKKWEAVFQARFLDQLSQREAAARLGVHRTTLVYQEMRIHSLLRRFLLSPQRSKEER